jgi:hypothetical protein
MPLRATGDRVLFALTAKTTTSVDGLPPAPRNGEKDEWEGMGKSHFPHLHSEITDLTGIRGGTGKRMDVKVLFKASCPLVTVLQPLVSPKNLDIKTLVHCPDNSHPPKGTETDL